MTSTSSSNVCDSVGIAYTLRRDVFLIGVERPGIANAPDFTARAYLAAAAAEVNPIFITQASAAGSFCAVVPAKEIYAYLDALRSEFVDALARREVLNLWARSDVVLIDAPLVACALLGAEDINLLTIQTHYGDRAWFVIAARDQVRAENALRVRPACYNQPHLAPRVLEKIGDHESHLYPQRLAGTFRSVPPTTGGAYSGVGSD